MKPSLVNELMRSVEDCSIPTSIVLTDVLKEINETRAFIQKLLNIGGGGSIYGLNTLPGHRDNETIGAHDIEDLQVQIIRSHLVPGDSGFYSRTQSRYITFAKLKSVANGGTGLSEQSFQWLVRAVQDRDFLPKINRNQSYSSGDVIPAAHWTWGLMEWINRNNQNYHLAEGDAMALINGNFVHLGLALSQVENLRKIVNVISRLYSILLFAVGHRLPNFQIVEAKRLKSAYSVLSYIDNLTKRSQAKEIKSRTSISPQLPVSIRAAPEVVMTLCLAIDNFEKQLESELIKKSANPIYFPRETCVYSQASFLAPAISISQSGLTEALLFCCEAIINQVRFVFSGDVKDIPIDGKRAKDKIGTVQIIKEMRAQLEHQKLVAGRKLFASSISTSNGIEDLCTFGISASAILDDLINFSLKLSARALLLIEIVRQVIQNRSPVHFELDFVQSDFLVDILFRNEVILLDLIVSGKFNPAKLPSDTRG